MKTKSMMGPALVVFFAVLTVLVWAFVRWGTPTFSDYASATRSLGQLAGLVGLAIFSLTFVLTTRAKWVESLFGGLDKVYKSHHIMGASAFILFLFHPLLLVLNFIPNNLKQAALYLLPITSWPVNFGIIALVALAILIILTLYISMKYQNWKISHKFMGIVYFIALLHVFLVTTDITYYPVLRYYMLLIAGIGTVAYIYGSFLRGKLKSKVIYVVDSVRRESEITVIELMPKEKKLVFNPGQFAFIRFLDERISGEQHPFSIASSPLNGKLRFAIKNVGDFTFTLNQITKGMEVELEGPYGEEMEKLDYSRNLVWLAGGIGITPFLGLVDHLKRSKTIPFGTSLFYCTNTKSEAIFFDELEGVSREVKNFRVIPWFSKEKGRINSDALEKFVELKDSDFFLCGPPSMMESIFSQLRGKGVARGRIHFEEFNLK